MAKSYIFFEDPGHGWLRVPLTELEPVKTLISPYSYRKGRYAYLEEDCDAFVFLQHKFGKCVSVRELENKGILKNHHTNNSSSIRNYPHYYMT
jgi:hypothetical protein